MNNSKFIVLFAVMAITTIGLNIGPVYGQANVLRGVPGCSVYFGPDAGGTVTSITQVVFTNNQQDNSMLRCQVDDFPNPTGHAIVLKGFLCGQYQGGSTTDSHAVLSASGQGTLTCHFRD